MATQAEKTNMENEQNSMNSTNSTNNEASTAATNPSEQNESATSKARKDGKMNPNFNAARARNRKAAMTAKKASQEFYKQVNDLAQANESVPSCELMTVLEKFKRLSVDRTPPPFRARTKSDDPNKKDTTRPPRTKRPTKTPTQQPSYTPEGENATPAQKQKSRPFPRRQRRHTATTNNSKANSEQSPATEIKTNEGQGLPTN